MATLSYAPQLSNISLRSGKACSTLDFSSVNYLNVEQFCNLILWSRSRSSFQEKYHLHRVNRTIRTIMHNSRKWGEDLPQDPKSGAKGSRQPPKSCTRVFYKSQRFRHSCKNGYNTLHADRTRSNSGEGSVWIRKWAELGSIVGSQQFIEVRVRINQPATISRIVQLSVHKWEKMLFQSRPTFLKETDGAVLE